MPEDNFVLLVAAARVSVRDQEAWVCGERIWDSQVLSTVWYVGSLTARPELLPRDARVASAHVRSFLASDVGEWLPIWGALWSLGELWA